MPFGDGIKNDFLAKLFERANKTLAEEGEYYKEERERYDAVMEEGKKIIESIDSPERAMQVSEEIKGLNHVLTSLAELRQVYKDKIKALGYVWDADKKAYTAPKQPKADESDTNGKPSKKGGKKAPKNDGEQQTIAPATEGNE